MAHTLTGGESVFGRRTVASDVTTAAPAYEAYQILHIAFTAAPLLAGLDKVFHLLVNWDMYLAPAVARMLPIGAHQFMLAVGVIEIIAGLLVAIKPKIGAYVVAAWLLGIICNLLLTGTFYDSGLMHRN